MAIDITQIYYKIHLNPTIPQLRPTCSSVRFITGPTRYCVMYGSSGRNSFKKPKVPILKDNHSHDSISETQVQVSSKHLKHHQPVYTFNVMINDFRLFIQLSIQYIIHYESSI